jgi:hypothetical protein
MGRGSFGWGALPGAGAETQIEAASMDAARRSDLDQPFTS